MPLLIDTYNVLHTVGILPPDHAGPDVQSLIKLISTSRYRNQRAILICDGIKAGRGSSVSRHRNVQIRYSGVRHLADDLIEQEIRKSSAPRRLIVVSSDRRILRAARQRKCKVLTSRSFLRHLASDLRKHNPDSHDDKPVGKVRGDNVDYWLQVFNITSEGLHDTVSSPSRKKKEKKRSKRARKKQSNDPLPQSIIEEAERMWDEYHKS